MDRAYALGAKRSAPEKLARTKPAHMHPRVAAVLAGDAGVDRPVNHLPPRFDQGQSGSCTAHAASGAVCASCAAMGRPLPAIPSPKALYGLSGAIERSAATLGGALPELTDTGRELADNVTAIASCGITPMTECPTPDGRQSDLWTAIDTADLPQPPPANVNAEPSGIALERADVGRLSGAYTVDLTAANAVEVCVASLDAGCALYVGFFCDTAFQKLGSKDVAQPSNPNDPTGGGHAVFLADYRIVNGQYEFLLVNSWGTLWALDGTVWVSTAWLLAAWECWVMSESLVATGKS